MNPESFPKTERVLTPDEAAEAIRHMKSISEKYKLFDDQMRAIDEEGKKDNNSEKHARLGEIYSQFETMKKSLAETFENSKPEENNENIPTLTGDTEIDDVFRAQLAPEISSNVGEIKPEKTSEIIPEKAPDVPQNIPVVVAQENTATQTMTEVAPIAQKIITPPTPDQPSAPTITTPAEDPKVARARTIAEKIKTHPQGILALDENEEKFKNENYDLVSQEMIKKNNPLELVIVKTETPAEKLQRAREEYIKALFDSRKNPNQEGSASRLKLLEDEYRKNISEGQKMIEKETTDPKVLLDSMFDERRAYNREMFSLQVEDVQKRISESLKKFEFVAGNVFLYSILLTGKLIGNGIDAVKQGINKLTSGSGKGWELLKKKIAEAKANSGNPDEKFIDSVLSPLHKMFGGETGKRPFELGTKEQQEIARKKAAEEKKVADAAKKTEKEEQKKVDNGEKKKTPEELEKSQVKNFLKTSFESGNNGQLTDQEQKNAFAAWKKLKDKPVHLFMKPETGNWGTEKNDKGEEVEVKKTVADYSKAEYGLYKKLKDAYDDAQYNNPMGDGMTLEQFIKESLKNGTIK